MHNESIVVKGRTRFGRGEPDRGSERRLRQELPDSQGPCDPGGRSEHQRRQPKTRSG
ncbi:hypothetical protein SDC9_211738 [bioreactor metagenome]|uniref:Uncharacterized protein n=1 Tax=bioreactor metagenome TaxID=1076179 RepID=A0A645JMK0_9ZZZZ